MSTPHTGFVFLKNQEMAESHIKHLETKEGLIVLSLKIASDEILKDNDLLEVGYSHISGWHMWEITTREATKEECNSNLEKHCPPGYYHPFRAV
jgi:hypothetical protein